MEVSANCRGFAAVALLGLSACSWIPPAATPASLSSALRLSDSRRSSLQQTYPTGGLLLFAGDTTLRAVLIYQADMIGRNPLPLAAITDSIYCPYGMALDSRGTLYVANNCANTITEYPKGQTIHSASITNGVSNPLGIVIDSKGTLYVANRPASITEYSAGATSPSVTITSRLLEDPLGLALDENGNLFIADYGQSKVLEVAAGTTTVRSLGLKDLTEPLNLAFDKSDNLWVTDGKGDKVNVYAPGQTRPFQSITRGYSFPYQITSDRQGTIAISNAGDPPDIYVYKPGRYTSYATLTSDVRYTTGLLLGKP